MALADLTSDSHRRCGNSVGIYFLVKRCIIIYLYADKGTFSTAPYLDVHGEADPGFKKRRPLYLNSARYDEIRKLWLNHSVATLVARKLESGNDPGGWNTF
jgi:E3 ubiquitin-protein ligase UBR1